MPEQIQTKLIEEEMKESYIDYAMSVIMARALPDVHDGLKPVHRRILFAMHQLGLASNKPTRKSARIVGECFTKNTKVLTTNGLIPINEINREDLIYTQRGIEEVSELYEMPKKELLNIKLKNGISNIVTKLQRFKVLNKKLEFEWKEAKDLTKDDYIVIRAHYPEIKENVKLKVFNNRYIALNENIAYLIGQFLSDGWIEKSTNRIAFYSTSKTVMDKIASILQTEFNYVSNFETKEYEFKTSSGVLLQNLGYQIRINDLLLSSFLAKTFNFIGKDASTKEIPYQILLSPKKVIYSFISGLIDGDGSIHKSRNVIHYGSVSEKLIDKLLLLTQQLGIIGKKRSDKRSEHELNGKIIKSNFPFYYIEFTGEFSRKLAINLSLFEEEKAKKSSRIALTKLGKSNFEVIPFAGEILFEELSNKHIGGGWYRDTAGKKFRSGIKYSTGAKIRYSKDLREKNLRKSQIIEWGIKDKLERINSKYSSFIKEVLDKNLFFIKVDSIKSVESEKTYDIRTGESHEFIANGMISHNCLGKFHPHGDTAVYDALVRMAQDFSLRYPLIIGQGNFGSVDGDAAAAQRYTEAKLSKVAEELLTDIEKNTVNFIPNFDNSLKEPIVLPAKIPNLLVNGTSGIAVGMASNIPPHNISEVIDAIVAAINNPGISIEELMQYIKGPDFPTGGIIAGTFGIRQAYKTGRGKVIVKAKTEIEKNKILITEIPYQVNKTILIESIANLVKEKKVTGIKDLRDESDRKGMRIVVELRGNANAEVILNQLYKHTQLQNTFGINMIALDAGQPKIMNLKDIVTSYIKHRFRIITRRTKFDLNKAEDRAHILAGLKIALANIDEVVKTIKKSESPEVAKQSLIKNYKLSTKQAQAILDMKLQRLTSLEQNKIQKEYENLLKLIEELKEILASEERILEIIKEELLELKEKYKDDRRTLIEESHEVLETEDLIQEEDVVITATYSGYIKQTKLNEYKEQKRGGKGVIATGKKEEDIVEHLFITSNHHYLLFFTNLGKVHWLKAYQIPLAGRYSRGNAIVNLLNLQEKEKINAILPVSKFDTSFILFSTKKGLIKKTALKEFSHPRKGGIIAINLRPKDELISTRLIQGNLDILMASRNGLAVRFNEKDVKNTGRKSIGVRGIRLNKGDKVVGMELADKDETLLTVTENGFGKRTNTSEYRLIRRGGKGVINIKTSDRNGKVIGIKVVSDEDEVMFITEKGNIIRTKVKGISTISRNTQGVRLMKLKDKDKVNDVAKVVTNHD